MDLSISAEHKFYDRLPERNMVGPRIVGYFSVDEHGEYYPGAEQLKYLNWDKHQSRKHTDLDLNKGIESVIKCGEGHRYKFYRYLSANPSMVHDFSAKTLKEVGFICNRSTLKMISDLPYQREEAKFAGFLYQGNIYLNYLKPKEVTNTYLDLCTRWGHKFEQFMLSDSPLEKPKTDSPVKEGEALNCVFQLKVNDNKILYVAEIDAILCENNSPDALKCEKEDEVIEFLQNKKFVELKTSAQRFNQHVFDNHKSRKMWLQSYFGNVQTIVIGYRNNVGHIYDIKKYKMDEMKNRGKGNWSPKTCFNFCDEFLTFVKDCFAKRIVLEPGNIKDLQQMELFFTKTQSSSRISCGGSTDIERPYLCDWFLRNVYQDVSQNKLKRSFPEEDETANKRPKYNIKDSLVE